MGISNLVGQTGAEFLQLNIPAEWKFLTFIFGALFIIDIFVPLYLYADGTKRNANGLEWAAGAFFTMALLELAGIASGSFGVWILMTVLALLAPYVYLFVYLMLRYPLSQPVCATCGSVLEPLWKTCPYCDGALAVATAGAPAIAPAPQMPYRGPETNVGSRGGGSTLVKPREAKRTVRTAEKNEGPTLGWLVKRSGPGTGKEYKVSREQVKIGRDSSNDLVIPSDVEISRQHARLRMDNGKFILYDLGSANGTNVNGQEIQKAILDDGDKISLGTTELVFKKV